MDEQRELIHRVQMGDKVAYAELLRPLLGAATGLAFGLLQDRCAAEDCVQEAATRAWLRIGNLESGRSFRPWFSGIVVKRCQEAHNPNGAGALIDWLTKPRQQAMASTSLGFFPVVQNVSLTGPAAAESRVAAIYEANARPVQSVPPAGLGARSDDFTAVYQDTFRRIVLGNEDISAVLNEEAVRLQDLVNAAGAMCWPPDTPSRGSCQIK